MESNYRKKNRGQGIVSVIVAAGVGAIVLGFLTDMLVKQGVSQKFISQKLEMNDLTGSIMTTFSKANNCTCQFSGDASINPNSINYAANLKFDSSVINGTQVIDVKKIYAGCRVGGQMPILIAEEGQPLPGSSSLRVDKVQFVNLVPTGGGLNEWQGQWSISFQVGANSAIRSVRPILVTQRVTVNPLDIPNTRIIACSGTSTGSGTINFLSKWSPITGVLEDSSVFEEPISKNLGIGTTVPVAPLHVFNNVSPQTVRFDGANADSTGLYINNSAAGGRNYVIASTGNGNPNLGGKFLIGDATAGGVGRLAIDSTGNVGIGTMAPSNTSRLEVANPIGHSILSIQAGVPGDSSKHSTLRFYGEFGNLPNGLGGTGKDEGLEVRYENNGNTFIDSFIEESESPGSGIFFRTNAGTGGTGANPDPTKNAMTILSTGNVGIGITNPGVNLDVNGGVRPGAESTVTNCGMGKVAGEGTQRYNYTTHQMEYCNGTAWVASSGGGNIWGAPIPIVRDTSYLAAKDGLVTASCLIATVPPGDNHWMAGYTSPVNPPTATIVARDGATFTAGFAWAESMSITFPVKAGNYYQVSTGSQFGHSCTPYGLNFYPFQ